MRVAAGLAACVTALSAGAVDLPYQSPDQHLGVGSCASSVCHGSVTASSRSEVSTNEFVTWSHQDAHSKTYDALSSERGRSIAAKLGLESAQRAKICLDCHADQVPAAQRGPKFALSDGVGCEACHGGAQRWIAGHSMSTASYRGNVDQGMYPLANLSARSRLCQSCHLGNADKFANHRIMGAGHPRLSFELDTFLALQPVHYVIDADYRRRKPTYGRARTWAQSQLEASVQQLQILTSELRKGGSLFPELALFNCADCHDSSMHRSDWRQRAMTHGVPPGTVTLNDAHWRMSWLIARVLDPAEGERVLAAGEALQKAALAGRGATVARAQELAAAIALVDERAEHATWSDRQTSRLIDGVLSAAIEGQFRDYLGAEQAVMAVDLLLIEQGQATRFRPQLDELYRQVNNDEKFRPEPFAKAMQGLRDASH
jgi:Cytochrome c554 and c-prime